MPTQSLINIWKVGGGGTLGGLNAPLPIPLTPCSHPFHSGSCLLVLFRLQNVIHYNVAKIFALFPSSCSLGRNLLVPLFSCFPYPSCPQFSLAPVPTVPFINKVTYQGDIEDSWYMSQGTGSEDISQIYL